MTLSEARLPVNPFTAKRVLISLRGAGPPTTEELTARVGTAGRQLKAPTVEAAARELQAAGLVIAGGDGEPACWQAPSPLGNDLLEELDLRGPHDFRHTLSTWLEDAGIPARVIDEIMGHRSGHSSRRSQRDSGSRIGTRYRHTTPDMAARVVEALQARLAVVLRTAEEAIETNPNRLTLSASEFKESWGLVHTTIDRSSQVTVILRLPSQHPRLFRGAS